MRRLLGKFKKQTKNDPKFEPEDGTSPTTERQAPPTHQSKSPLYQGQETDLPHAQTVPVTSSFDPETGGFHRPGNGYNPEAETRHARWHNPTNTALRDLRREELGLHPGDDPEWDIDDAEQLDLEQLYAEAEANAYKIPTDGPMRTRTDLVNMMLDKVDLTKGKGKKPLPVVTLCEVDEKGKANESMLLPRSQWQYGFQLMESPYPDNDRMCPWFGNGRLVGGQVATDRVRAWLGRCLMDHKGECGLPQPDPYHAGFRAIDVETRCVVEELDASKSTGVYVALSYVWGKSAQLLNTAETRDRLGQPGGLSDSHADIPQTIKDAMILTERLRIKYLWVDALCIRQDDDVDRGAQLDQMDQVYSRALITIVGACGKDCNSGLAGVQPGSRSFVPEIETVEGIQLSPFAEPFRASILSSEWDTRGWTLQEKLLSHRVIVVTPTQMFWKCANGTWYEDCWLETPECHTIDEEHRWHFFDDESADCFDRYRYLATAFVFRRFTHESDAEKAIKGINNKLSTGLGSAFHCGVPEKYLDAVILWDWPGVYNLMLLPRMEYFASWSWIALTMNDADSIVKNDSSPVLWGAAINATEYIDSHTRMRMGQWPKICSLVEYYRFDSAGDPIKIKSSVFQGNLDRQFTEYLIEHQLPPINIPMLPLRFHSNAEEYVRLATVLRTTPQAHCLFPHTMRMLLPRMLGFCAQTAYLYVTPAAQRAVEVSKPVKFDVALDESIEQIIGSVMLNYSHRLTQPDKMLFAVVARHVSNGPHATLPRASGWFFQCLLLEQAFDADAREALGPYSDIVYRKVAVLFDVDCKHWENAKSTLQLIILI
ncbi:unnamed protein product [Alternaria alternata]